MPTSPTGTLFGPCGQEFTGLWQLGFHPIKINVVVLRGINDDEIEDLARLTYAYPFHVRFIEFMPFNALVPPERYISGDEVLARLNRIDTLVTFSQRQ